MKGVLHTLSVLALGGLLACSGGTDEAAPSPEPVTLTPGSELPAEHPAVDRLNVKSRGPRRMSVTQLERSLDAIGNLEPGTIVIPPDLALTLGRPDYLRVYETSLEPSPLFMKFMMDLGGFVCSGLADAEATRPAETRVFSRYPDRDENLRYMVLRFLGLEGADADPYVTRLGRVYDAAAPAEDIMSGYEAACIALVTSPEFLLY